MKKLATEMRKAEIEMQRDGAFVSGASAMGRLKGMYQVVKESMGYVKEVVEFMNFELGDQIHGKMREEQDGTGDLPKRAD
jgi:hypothetical protein